MISNLTQWTEQTPSRFGMPIDGSTYATACAIDATGVSTALRDRQLAGVVRTVKGAFPGNSAWSPPIC